MISELPFASSLRAKLFIWKYVAPTSSFFCKSNLFSYERFCTRSSSETEAQGKAQCLLMFVRAKFVNSCSIRLNCIVIILKSVYRLFCSSLRRFKTRIWALFQKMTTWAIPSWGASHREVQALNDEVNEPAPQGSPSRLIRRSCKHCSTRHTCTCLRYWRGVHVRSVLKKNWASSFETVNLKKQKDKNKPIKQTNTLKRPVFKFSSPGRTS